MAAKLKKGDKVVVLAGKDKGKEGEISAVMPKANKAIVDGVNIAIRKAESFFPCLLTRIRQIKSIWIL